MYVGEYIGLHYIGNLKPAFSLLGASKLFRIAEITVINLKSNSTGFFLVNCPSLMIIISI